MGYIEYYKEKDTDPMVFLQRFRCTTEPIGGGTEHDEEGELVSWDAAVAAIEIAMKRLGWRPGSELPKEGELVLVSGSFKNRIIGASGAIFSKGEFYVASTFDDPKVSRCIITGIKWWCYPPKEEEQ